MGELPVRPTLPSVIIWIQQCKVGSNNVKLVAKTDDDCPLSVASKHHHLIKGFMVVKELITSKTKMTAELLITVDPSILFN